MAEAWNAQRLNESLQKGKLKPLYFLYGDETFLIDEAVRTLESVALGEGLRDFNLHTFYGGETDSAAIRDAVEQFPMMANRRVVIVKEAQELKDRDWDMLMPVLEAPVDTAVVVCVSSKIDKRKKHFKRFSDNGAVVEFKRPYENQIPGWIEYIAGKHGLRLNEDAVSVMHQFVGSNLTDINSEMSKLALYLGERTEATAEDIMTAVSRVRMDSVFDLTDAIGSNDRARALVCLANLLDNGQNEVGVLALISRHVRILKTVREGVKEGLTGQKLSSRAGVSPFFLKQYVEQSRSWAESKIDRTFRALLDTDRALKSSPVAAHIWLENFIVQTCSH